jgi:hypothetical protein
MQILFDFMQLITIEIQVIVSMIFFLAHTRITLVVIGCFLGWDILAHVEAYCPYFPPSDPHLWAKVMAQLLR